MRIHRSGLTVMVMLAVAGVTGSALAFRTEKAFGFTRDFGSSRYSVRLVLPGDLNPAGNSQVYVDFTTGHVLAVRLAPAASAGLRFLYWQFSLRSGEAFGLPGQAAISISGLALVLLCVSGLSTWRKTQ